MGLLYYGVHCEQEYVRCVIDFMIGYWSDVGGCFFCVCGDGVVVDRSFYFYGMDVYCKVTASRNDSGWCL